ncbi:MAG: sigma-70 family RNA polymerase sigma factor [Acidimicrobiia bacterium]
MTAGDARFVELYERFHRHVYAYCRRRTHADMVEDAVADIFLTVWHRIDQVPEGDESLPWLYGVAFRVLSHQWRGVTRRRRLSDKLASIGAESVMAPEEYIVMGAESQMVHEALGRLKPTDQEILRLTAWEELALRDVAFALGISVGAVRQRLHKARKNLTREFNQVEKKSSASPAARKEGAWWQQKNV